MTFIVLTDGGYIDCSGPKPIVRHITIRGIAMALSNIQRFTGNARHYYSVARHSIDVARCAQALGYDAQYALLHDAAEVITSDVPGPLKIYLPGFRRISDDLTHQILDIFNVHKDPRIKKIEKSLIATEFACGSPQSNLYNDYIRDNIPDPYIHDVCRETVSCHVGTHTINLNDVDDFIDLAEELKICPK